MSCQSLRNPEEGPWIGPYMAMGKMTGQRQPWKLTPLLWNLGPSHTAVQFSWGPLPCWALPTWMSLSNKVFCFVSRCASSDSSFPNVRQEPTHSEALEGVPLMVPLSDGGGGLVTKSCLTLAIPWDVACQPPLSVGFSRQEYWSGLPFPSPLISFRWCLFSYLFLPLDCRSYFQFQNRVALTEVVNEMNFLSVFFFFMYHTLV